MDTKEREGVEDHDLLMEILEAREELDEASGDEIEQLREANHGEFEVGCVSLLVWCSYGACYGSGGHWLPRAAA
jgi:hypothetical protein